MQSLQAPDNDFVVLRRFIGLVLRRWWLPVLAVALAVAGAYEYTKRQPPVYQATTSLIVGQTIQSVDLSARDIQISGQVALVYADMARRQPVLQATVETLGLNMSWRQLKSLVSVKVDDAIYLIEITANGPSPEAAQAIANEIARRLILLSPTVADNEEPDANQRFVDERLIALRRRIQDAQAKLEDLEAAVLRGGPLSRTRDLQSEIYLLQGLISDWESTYAQLLALTRSEESANFLAVIEPAQALPYPVRPNLYLNAAVAALLGFAVALGLIFTHDYLDQTFKTNDDLVRFLNTTSLGVVGRIRGRHPHDKLLTEHDYFSPVAECFRIIRSNLRLQPGAPAHKSLVVTSAVYGEGKSMLAANLAISLAQAGCQTVLVDADLRQPSQHSVFQRPNRRGLTDLLRSPEVKLEACLSETHVPGLRLLTAGALPSNPAELLGSARMAQVLGSLTQMVDIVIFDGPPAVSIADTAVLAARADGVVLLVQAGRTSRALAQQAMVNLERAGATVLGTVLNRATARHSHYPVGRRGSALSAAVSSTWRWLLSSDEPPMSE